MQTEIRQTIFQAQPLQNVVGVGNTTAYQVVVQPGAKLGHFGSISVPAQADILNDPQFARNTARAARGRMVSWFHGALATIQS